MFEWRFRDPTASSSSNVVLITSSATILLDKCSFYKHRSFDAWRQCQYGWKLWTGAWWDSMSCIWTILLTSWSHCTIWWQYGQVWWQAVGWQWVQATDNTGCQDNVVYNAISVLTAPPPWLPARGSQEVSSPSSPPPPHQHGARSVELQT